MIREVVDEWRTWFLFPEEVRKILGEYSSENRRFAIRIGSRGPRSRKLIYDFVYNCNDVRRISIADLYLAVIKLKISIAVIRELATTKSLSGILIHEIIRYYDVFEERLKNIIICTENGHFDPDSQLDFVRDMHQTQDVNVIKEKIDKILSSG